MTTLAFLTAVYNEEDEIADLLESVRPFVDTIVVSDDDSADMTLHIVLTAGLADVIVTGEHLASCEEVRIRGFNRITEDWVLILDADERISSDDMKSVRLAVDNAGDRYTHIYFSQDEYIDGELTKTFAKLKAARRDCLNLPTGIHDDITATGEGINVGAKVIHRKTSIKQRMREHEYISAYKRKIREGKMTPERARQVTGWHYFVHSDGE